MAKKYSDKKNIEETQSVYDIVTDRILSQMDEGIIPWHKPWITGGAKSWVTNKPYSFLNQILCEKVGSYMTFNQIEKQKGKLKKGSKGTFVTFYKRIPITHENEEGEEETRVVPMLRYYYVFHQDDIEGINFPKVGNDNVKLENPEQIIQNYIERESKLTFSDGFGQAYFRPSTDSICVPKIEHFDTSEHYYATVFHEMIHSTAKAYRCNRPLDGKFGNDVYSKEELVAEMGSAILYQMCGIASDLLIDNSVAYLQNWMSAIGGDKKLIVQAAGKAQKAVNYILQGKESMQDNEETENETVKKAS